jgi:uncharacterized repeat protein (TIGR02543 family)
MEKEYQISWGKVIGILALIVFVIAIIVIVYPKKELKNGTSNTYINNINLMKEAGFEYFVGNNLPDKIGESNKITLDDMVNANLLLDFKDEAGNTCNKEESYIKVTKSLDNEYSMKVFLSCKENSDYIVTTIVNNCPDCIIDKENSNNNSNNVSNNNNSSSSGGSNNYSKPGNTTNITYNINYVTNNCSSGNCTSNVYYTVSFLSNGGTDVEKQTVRSGDTATYVASTRVGYEFLGWYLDGEKYDFNTPVTRKITLVAKWKEKQNKYNEYDVCFVTNGGTKISCQTVLEGDTAYKPSNPTKSCYNFDGWYTDSNFKYQYNFNTRVYDDITLYAKWVDNGTCKNKYTVSFNSNGGSSVSAQKDILEGDTAYRPNNPTKACSRFVGWYTNSSLTNLYNFKTPVYKNMTLYAKWEDDGSCKETYRVKFDSNGGTSVSTQYVYDGDRAYEPSDPWRSGYKFIGWYYNGSRFDFNKRIYRDYTLVAKWEKEDEKYNTYCKINNERYFSTSYVNGNQTAWNYNWTIRFDKIKSNDLKITNVGYLNTTSLYNQSYSNLINGRGISMVGGNNVYSVLFTSGSMLKTYSLKSTNFNKYLSSPYKSNGVWYTDATVNIRNYNNVTKYYAPNLKDYIYFVPFYFDVEYTDQYNCFDDKASNSYKYKDDYKIVNTYYR